jgi:hypothetical protein
MAKVPSPRSLLLPILAIATGVSALSLDVAGLVAQRGQGRNPLADPFVGVTTDGSPVPGLFPIRASGVSTAPVREAAARFLDALTPAQRAITAFAVDDDEWRLWNNVHRYARQGVRFKDMSETQRDLGFALMRAGLSARGFERSRNAMRLNGYVAELVNNFEEYGEYLYHLTVMGTPSATDPWGWQLDGHHLVINYFVLGDQVVMTPTFMGSEPVKAASGKYVGTEILRVETERGLTMIQSLNAGRHASSDDGKLRLVGSHRSCNRVRSIPFHPQH